MTRFTLTMEDDLFQLLQNRARFNRRSMSNELVFLLEAALAAEMEGNLDIYRALMYAQGGPTDKNPSAPEAQ